MKTKRHSRGLGYGEELVLRVRFKLVVKVLRDIYTLRKENPRKFEILN